MNKCIGMNLTQVAINVDCANLSHGLFYTALTRVRRLDDVFLFGRQKKFTNIITTDDTVARYYQRLERRKENETLDPAFFVPSMQLCDVDSSDEDSDELMELAPDGLEPTSVRRTAPEPYEHECKLIKDIIDRKDPQYYKGDRLQRKLLLASIRTEKTQKPLDKFISDYQRAKRNSKAKEPVPDVADVFIQTHNPDGIWTPETVAKMVLDCRPWMLDGVRRKLSPDVQELWKQAVARIEPFHCRLFID